MYPTDRTLGSLVEGLSLQDRQAALRHLSAVNVEATERITIEGTTDPMMAWLEQGRASVEVAGRSLMELEPGSVIGGEDVFAKLERTFTVVADKPCRLLIADLEQLDRIAIRVPRVGTALELSAVRTICRLLRGLDYDSVAQARQFIRENDAGLPGLPLLASIVETPTERRTLATRRSSLQDPIALLEELGVFGEPLELATGQVLIREGRVSEAVHLVRSGSLLAVTELDPHTFLKLGVSPPGATVGVGSAIFGGRHTATCVAIEPTVVMRLERQRWLGVLMLEHPAASPVLQRSPELTPSCSSELTPRDRSAGRHPPRATGIPPSPPPARSGAPFAPSKLGPAGTRSLPCLRLRGLGRRPARGACSPVA